jgi:beta-lactamase regulating signal transducer with metallopeptidase domain
LCLVAGSAIAIFGWLVLRAFPRLSASARFGLWLATLLAVGLTSLTFRSQTQASSTAHSGLTMPSAWAVYVVIVWAVIATIALGRVLLGLFQLRALRKTCIRVDHENFSKAVREALARSGRKNLVLCTSDRIQVPTAIGFLKPAIVIPDWLLRELSPAELEHVVLHEASHLRRHDDWTNFAQKLLKAVLFFQPVVWWLDTQLTQEREMACDDLVLRQTGNPRAYAECLASLARKSYLRRTVLLAQAAVSRLRHTTARVARILKSEDGQPTAAVPHDHWRRWQPAACGVALAAAVTALSTVGIPQLISFSDAGSHEFVAARISADKLSSISPAMNSSTAQAIPASLTIQATTLPRALSLSAPASPTPARQNNVKNSSRTMRRSHPSLANTPRLLVAKAANSARQQPEAQYQTVIFVTQTTSSDGYGPVSISWTLCVWHISSEPVPSAIKTQKVI